MATQALNIPKVHDVLYSRKFLLDKNFTKVYLCIAGIFDFCQYGKGRHMLYVSLTHRSKNLGNKIFTEKTGWKNWQTFPAIRWYMYPHARNYIYLHVLAVAGRNGM